MHDSVNSVCVCDDLAAIEIFYVVRSVLQLILMIWQNIDLSDLCFAGNVDSFPFQQISGALYVHFLAKVMPKFSVNFGLTCARKLDISSA